MNDLTSKNVNIEEASVISSRRQFLKHLACGSLVVVGSSSSLASAAVHHVYGRSSPSSHSHKPSPIHKPHLVAHKGFQKQLALENPNTGESLNRVYFENGRYVKSALQEFNHLLRDFHTETMHPIDPTLLDQLYDLKQTLAIRKPIHIISAYRSPYTNANLRRQTHGVAKHSLHMEGRAIDIRVEGVSSRYIRNAAVAMGKGGVGYYPDANFVHLDTGDVRIW
ncbi:hypothetical protein JCM14076_17840 [Methylosoma difficile]